MLCGEESYSDQNQGRRFSPRKILRRVFTFSVRVPHSPDRPRVSFQRICQIEIVIPLRFILSKLDFIL